MANETNAEEVSRRVDEYTHQRVAQLMQEQSELATCLREVNARLDEASKEDGQWTQHEINVLASDARDLEERLYKIDREVETIDLINQMLRGKISYASAD